MIRPSPKILKDSGDMQRFQNENDQIQFPFPKL